METLGSIKEEIENVLFDATETGSKLADDWINRIIIAHEREQWIPIKLPLTEAQPLPEIDECVEWLYENGGVCLMEIDKDDDTDRLSQWLGGSKLTGPITHWRRVVRPEEME